MRIAAVGNYGAPWCTEVHIARALELNGHDVVEHQENDPAAWARLGRTFGDFDFVLWTRTWDEPAISRPVLEKMSGRVPIVGYHLDRWWGLSREREIRTQQFFAWCDVICTADGGHDQQWADAGIVHWWYPPGVLGEEAQVDTQAQWLDGPGPDVVFVGSHRGYHSEWSYRQDLVAWLRKTYAGRVSFYPDETTREYPWRGRMVQSQQVRGVWLNALYQHTPVVVGDSCLAGSPARYWSDRVPETIGRGGLLIHPTVEGGFGDEHLLGGIHGLAYDVGDWAGLAKLIDWAVDDPAAVAPIRAAGRAKVLEHDTYECRTRRLVEQLTDEGLL